jgi:hypothetical protein
VLPLFLLLLPSLWLLLLFKAAFDSLASSWSSRANKKQLLDLLILDGKMRAFACQTHLILVQIQRACT